MAQGLNAESTARKRGRPRVDIDLDSVADAVAELFAEGGAEAVSIIDAAEKLQVSRATLYRTLPTKEHLFGVLFERSTRELYDQATAVLSSIGDPRTQLVELIKLLVDAAIRMRHYMPVFFGSSQLPSDVVSRWHKFSRDFEGLWVEVVTANMRAGDLAEADPVVTARLLLGQCIWTSRWYRPAEPYDAETIAHAAINLLPSRDPLPSPKRKTSPAE